MKKYITGKNGIKFDVEFFETIEDGKTGYYIHSDRYGYEYHKTKVYFRPEKTWNDHMGNTDCGYYVIAPLPTGEKVRVYMF